MKHHYAITIKNNDNSFTAYKCDLDAAIADLERESGGYVMSHPRGYEIDGKNKLHFHGILTTDRTPYIKRLVKCAKGYYIDIRPKHSDNWDAYCIKEARNKYLQDQILDTHWYRHHHMFEKDPKLV